MTERRNNLILRFVFAVMAVLLPFILVLSFFTQNEKHSAKADYILDVPMAGIDVSSWNKEIDWAKVKNAGVEFAIIRIFHHIKNTPNYELDEYFERNVSEAQKHGIRLGAYFFSYAPDLASITAEANMVVNELNKYPGVFSFPIVFDAEDGDYTDDPDVDGRDIYDIGDFAGDACKNFCNILSANGYYPMVYSYDWYFKDKIGIENVKDFDLWQASYPKSGGKQIYAGTGPNDAGSVDHSKRTKLTPYDDNVKMWQYTGAGKIDGIYYGDGGPIVDLNVSYVDYPSIIVEGGYNGYAEVHEHEYKLESKDDTYHYERCDCGEIKEGSERKHVIVNCKCSCGYERHNFEYIDQGDTHLLRCKYCGREQGEAEHYYEVTYKDETHHHLACACGRIKENTESKHVIVNCECECGAERHSYVFEKDQTGHIEKCKYCGAEKTHEDHDHVWAWNESEHYKICKCGDVDEITRGEHDFENGVCKICGYVKNADSTPPTDSEQGGSGGSEGSGGSIVPSGSGGSGSGEGAAQGEASSGGASTGADSKGCAWAAKDTGAWVITALVAGAVVYAVKSAKRRVGKSAEQKN